MFDLFLQLASTLFGRVDGPRGLAEQPLRARLLQMIEQKPGMHASGLQRETGEPWGTVQYHLSLLEKAELVAAVDTGRERHFFPPGMDTRRTKLVAMLGHGRRGDVARFIREHPGARQVDVCQGVDMSRKTFRASIGELVAEGLIEERLGVQSNRYYPGSELDSLLPRADATSSLTPPASNLGPGQL
jgi:predicted transcriptional regulator